MKIHKRIIDVNCTRENVKDITSLALNQVQVEVILQE